MHEALTSRGAGITFRATDQRHAVHVGADLMNQTSDLEHEAPPLKQPLLPANYMDDED